MKYLILLLSLTACQAPVWDKVMAQMQYDHVAGSDKPPTAIR